MLQRTFGKSGQRFILAAAGLVFFAAANVAQATRTIVVGTTADVSGTCTLRDAISTANSASNTGGCTIGAGSGKFIIDMTGLSGTITLGTALPNITTSTAIDIDGPGALTLAVDGNGSTCTVAPCGFTMLSIFSSGASTPKVTLKNLGFQNGVWRSSTAATGGAMNFNGSGSGGTPLLTISGCEFDNNIVTGGTLNGVGGAIWAANGVSLSVDSTTFNGNSASASGQIGIGGAASLGNAPATFTNCTFFGNSSSGSLSDGGALFVSVSSVSVFDCTFNGNSSAAGSAVYVDVPAATFNMANSIIAGNTGSAFDVENHGTVNTLGHNILGVVGGPGTYNVNGTDTSGVTNPLLLPLANTGGGVKTMALDLSSPAVNDGDTAVCQASPNGAGGNDERGKSRRHGYCDVGAYEAQLFKLIPTPPSTAGNRIKAVVSTAFPNLILTAIDNATSPGNSLDGIDITMSQVPVAPLGGQAAVLAPGGTQTTPAGPGATTGQFVNGATANANSGDYNVIGTSGAKTGTFFLRNYVAATGTAGTGNDPGEICAGACTFLHLTINTNASPPGTLSPGTFKVDFGDGSGSHNCVLASLPGDCSHKECPTVTTAYTISFLDTSGNPGVVTGNPVTITVDPLPVALAQTDITSICTGSTVAHLNGLNSTTPNSDAFTCHWAPATGLSNANSCTPTANPTVGQSPKTYCLTVTDTVTGCVSTNSSCVTITAFGALTTAPTITRNGPLTFCNGGSVTLTSSSATSYQWYQSNTQFGTYTAIGGQTSQQYIASTTAWYKVRIFNAGGCFLDSLPVQVTVLANPVPTIVSTPPATAGSVTVTHPATVTLTGPVGMTTYKWYKDAVLVGGATTKTLVISAVGSHNYYLVVINASGCTGQSNTIHVTIN